MSHSETEAIMKRLAELKEEENILAAEQKALWDAFWDIADQEAGEGKSYRFLNKETGQVIGRVLRQSQFLDDARLEGLLTPEQWEKVTILPVPVRLLDQTLLEAALKKGEIEPAVVEKCTTVKQVLARHGPRKASKEELAELEQEEGR